jgi:hypothetical protein
VSDEANLVPEPIASELLAFLGGQIRCTHPGCDAVATVKVHGKGYRCAPHWLEPVEAP